ncbi:MAG: hypothetical protein WCW14_04430, partial [Candidatus Paceibacterota bacterium]
MKVAIIGPIAKDIVIINGISNTHIGGIPYYVGIALKALGVDVKVFGTYAVEDDKLINENFKGVKLKSIYVGKTITHELSYSQDNPDIRETRVPEYSSNTFPMDDELINELRGFDYIILGPLYYENIPYELYEKLKDKNLVLNNFGLFTYHDKGELVRKNPENLARVAPFLQYLFLDEDEIRYGAQKETLEEAAQYFLSLGAKNV